MILRNPCLTKTCSTVLLSAVQIFNNSISVTEQNNFAIGYTEKLDAEEQLKTRLLY